MKFFRNKQRRKNYEDLPTQIKSNARIEDWHHDSDGALAYLVVNGTAESAASKEKYSLLLGLSILALIVGAFVLNGTVLAKVNGSGWLTMWGCFFAIYGLHHLWKWFCRDTRIFQIWDDRVLVRRPDGEREYALTDVVGVQLGSVDQQRIHEEQRKKRKQKDPKFLEPYSMDVFLQTSLGMEELGSIFGLKDAQEIANSMNAAIQYMKGRQGIGEGPVLNPAHQYRNKTAGQIPA